MVCKSFEDIAILVMPGFGGTQCIWNETTYRLVQIKRHYFSVEWYWTALFLTTKTGKTVNRFQNTKVLINTTKYQNRRIFVLS